MGSPILDTGVVGFTTTPQQFDRIRIEATEDALENYGNGQFANFNINNFTVKMDPLTGYPVVRQTRLRIRPEKHAVVHFQMLDLTADEVEDLPRTLNQVRLDETAAPFVDGNLDFERPEGAVLSTQDLYIFDESVRLVTEDEGISLELIADDINRQCTVAKHDFDFAVREEIDHLKIGKQEISVTRQDFFRLASSILRSIGMHIHSSDDALTEKTPAEVYTYVEQMVRTQTQAISHEVFDDVALLYARYQSLDIRSHNIETVSKDTMRDSLSSGAYYFPAIIGSADRAVDEFGIGNELWLDL